MTKIWRTACSAGQAALVKRRNLYRLFVSLLLAGCAVALTPLEKFPNEEGRSVAGSTLSRPQGAGPFPAIVLLHTCGGVQPHLNMWRRVLVDAGYVVLLVDSFTPRGVDSVCERWNISVDQVAADALAAGAFLRKLPFVDPSRIGVVGYSYGAMAALRLTSDAYVKRQIHPAPFRAAVAFYPWCTVTVPHMAFLQDNFPRNVTTPVHLFLGGADTETPAHLCTAHADGLKARGQPVSYTLFPGATHAFDMNYPPRGYRYDAQAVNQSSNEMRQFLAKQLK